MSWKLSFGLLLVAVAMIAVTYLVGFTDILHDETSLNRQPGYAEIILCGRELMAILLIGSCFVLGFLTLFANFQVNFPALILFGMGAVLVWVTACPFDNPGVPPV